MLDKPIVKIHEERPIERRGKKRASPLLEMSLSYHEEVLAYLLKIHDYTNGNETLYEGASSENTWDLIPYMGHLIKLRDFKRKHRQ